METLNELSHQVSAILYFGEDQPYTGLADREDRAKAETFLNQYDLEQIDYFIDEINKASLVWKHYPSQVEESYREGILNRSHQLKTEHKSYVGVERIYRLKR